MSQLDIDYVRSWFPQLADRDMAEASFFENAGGSLACLPTIEAIDNGYRHTKVQPYAPYPPSAVLGAAMDISYARWAEALGVDTESVFLGPSTSQNTYVVASALRELLGPGDEVIVTNQDHEANTGAIRRAAQAAGATIREWRVGPDGLLDVADLDELITESTQVLTMPHASNIIGHENDVAAACAKAHEVEAITVVDGVSFAPHGFPDVAAIGTDVYLFSLYKTYSVHQGLMVIDPLIAAQLPNQGHFFNADVAHKRFTPAGPDHVQVAAAGAVLDYVTASYSYHDGTDTSLRAMCGAEAIRWQDHERGQVERVLDALAQLPVRVLGADPVPGGRHRCPTVSIVPNADPGACVHQLVSLGVWCSSGDFYAPRLLEALGVDPAKGVVRVSWVHYTSDDDIDRLLDACQQVFTP